MNDVYCKTCNEIIPTNDFYLFGYSENPVRICFPCWENNNETLKFRHQHDSLHKIDHCCVADCIASRAYVFIHKVIKGHNRSMWSLCWDCYDSIIGIDLSKKKTPDPPPYFPTDTEIADAIVTVGNYLTKEETRKLLNWPEVDF